MRQLLHRLGGHAWTIAPTLRHRVAPGKIPPSVAWQTHIDEPDVGDVLIRGRYSRGGADTLVVAVHGLGGSPESAYLVPIVREAARRGWSSLRLALRGTGGVGTDFYHAGLTADVHAALADPAFAHYPRIFVVGFSLGGHIALSVAADRARDARIGAVAAVCPPIDLGAGATELDRPAQTVYREYILRELRALYRGVSRVAPVPTPWSRIRLVRSIREWDALTIVPRFGFRDIDDYYTSMSIAHRMHELALPALMVHSRHDPIALPHTVYPALTGAPPHFEAHWSDGAGHVFFPPRLDLGLPGELGLGAQVAGWLDARAAG